MPRTKKTTRQQQCVEQPVNAVSDSVVIEKTTQDFVQSSQQYIKSSEYGRAFEIKTIQSQTIKILFEALKEIITETNIVIDKDGLKIITLDSSEKVLIHLKLHADRFEGFYCDQQHVIGVNIINVYKILKTMNMNDTLILYMEKNDKNNLYIKFENAEKDTSTRCKINLMDLENKKMQIPDIIFNTVIQYDSQDFKNVLRNMSNISDLIEIRNTGNQLILECKGTIGEQQTIIKKKTHSDDDLEEKNEGNKHIIQGVFNLKQLVLFTKCSNLSNIVELFLNNDYPLIVKYKVTTLGEIKLCLAPHSNNE